MLRQSLILWITIVIACCALSAEGNKIRTASACVLPAHIIGTCRGSFSRWSYDVEKGSCENFIYGGCEGNNNNFDTLEECTKLCGNRDEIDEILKQAKAN